MRCDAEEERHGAGPVPEFLFMRGGPLHGVVVEVPGLVADEEGFGRDVEVGVADGGELDWLRAEGDAADGVGLHDVPACFGLGGAP